MAIVFFGWILFMEQDLASAGRTLRALFIPMSAGGVNFSWRYFLSNKTCFLLVVSAASIVIGAQPVQNGIQSLLRKDLFRTIMRILLLLLFVADIMFVVSSTYSPFIYFRF